LTQTPSCPAPPPQPLFNQAHSDCKLPILYVFDAIVKTVGGLYVPLFAERLLNMVATAHKQV
jgi:hypothetical protein